jgi:glycosyltransferase involved in cell wall biosynthesis
MMRVGLLTSDLSHRHGWAHYSLSLVEALRKASVDLTVITARNSPGVDGVELHRLLPNTHPAERHLLLKMLRVLPDVARTLRDCDVIHATIEPYTPLGAWVAGGRPLYVTAHGSYIPLLVHRRAGTFYRRAFSRAHVVSVSHYTERVIQATLPGVSSSVITHGIDAERFFHLPSLENPPVVPTVLSVGAVKRRKGTLELVQAMDMVREHVPDAQCIIIGSLDAEHDYVAQVKITMQSLNLHQTIHLLGHVPDETLRGWYGAANVFALPSLNVGDKFEGYGLVHLEASAAGLPVIGTRDCGAEDAIIDGVTGLLVPQVGVVDALAGAIIDLLTHPLRAKTMGAEGRARALSQSWDHTAQQWITMYASASARVKTR